MTSLERVKEVYGATYGEAVRRCHEYIFLNKAREHESLGYCVPILNCNEFGIDQERILMLSNKNLYRLKYDYDKKKIIHYSTTCLTDIVCIYFGMVYEGLVCSNNFGIKIVTRKRDGKINLASELSNVQKLPDSTKLFYRVYKSICPCVYGKVLAKELASIIAAVSKRQLICEDVRHVHIGGPISPILNFYGIGRWNEPINKRKALKISRSIENEIGALTTLSD
jgi:hypothetical protein